ncbi:MAG: PspC domain-containing protein [Acidimicrobiia bacterium]|nr:PspC domain-containing protein [Acidimicrobiia bacterium]
MNEDDSTHDTTRDGTAGGTGDGTTGTPGDRVSTPPPATADPPPATGRRLFRSRGDRMLGGVCGGVARTYGWDPTLVRLGMVLVALVTAGAAIVGYIAAWIIIPEGDPTPGGSPPRRPNGAAITGFILLGLGAVMLLDRLDLGPEGHFFWPIALILGGAAVLWLRGRDDVAAEADATATATSSAWPSRSESWPSSTASASAPAGPVRPPRPRAFLGPVTLSLVLIFVGCAWFADSAGALEVSPGAVLSIALIAVGAALVVGAWFGRARGLVGLAIPLTLVAAVLSVADIDLRGGVGERIYRPDSASEIRDRYRMAMGSLELDLRRVDFAPGVTEIDVSVAMGEIIVWAPDDVKVEVDSHVGAGELDLWGRTFDGVSIDETLAAGAGSDAVLRLETDVGLGTIEVHRSPATTTTDNSNDPEEILK